MCAGATVMDAGDHETALADQQVLSQCDYIVTTRESTMGFVAHASVYKPAFQVSPYEETCRFIPHSQTGLVQVHKGTHARIAAAKAARARHAASSHHHICSGRLCCHKLPALCVEELPGWLPQPV